MSYFVYVLLCHGNTYYTGITTNVEKRLLIHQSGKGAKYTRSHPPIRVVYNEEHQDRSAAQRREHQIKQLSHTQKGMLEINTQAIA